MDVDADGDAIHYYAKVYVVLAKRFALEPIITVNEVQRYEVHVNSNKLIFLTYFSRRCLHNSI